MFLRPLTPLFVLWMLLTLPYTDDHPCVWAGGRSGVNVEVFPEHMEAGEEGEEEEEGEARAEE